MYRTTIRGMRRIWKGDKPNLDDLDNLSDKVDHWESTLPVSTTDKVKKRLLLKENLNSKNYSIFEPILNKTTGRLYCRSYERISSNYLAPVKRTIKMLQQVDQVYIGRFLEILEIEDEVKAIINQLMNNQKQIVQVISQQHSTLQQINSQPCFG